MKYFFLKNSINIKEVGKFPQWGTIVKRGNLNNLPDDGYIKNTLDLPIPTLASNAKPTSYLDMSPVATPLTFMIIKNYFIDFLKEFKVGEYQKWGLEIHYRKDILNYYSLFYLPFPKQDSYVDYDLSSFYVGKADDWEYRGKEIKIENQEEYKTIGPELTAAGLKLKSDKMVLNFKSAKEDLIRLTNMPYGRGYYVSEKLKNAIIEKRFTGMEFPIADQLWNGRIKTIY